MIPTILPESCDDHDKKYWRYDTTAPRILRAMTHYLPSIPTKNRVPADVLPSDINKEHEAYAELERYFARGNSQHVRHYLFEYNPSIIRIPSEHIPDMDDDDDGKERPVYLSSYRVSTQQGCFPINTTLAMIGGFWEAKPRQDDYLALALLRSDLSILQDGIFNIPISFGKREDFRLFVLHGQIHVASFCQLTPLWLKAPSNMTGKTPVEHVFPTSLKIFIGSKPIRCSK
jgi:hypothetical protein